MIIQPAGRREDETVASDTDDETKTLLRSIAALLPTLASREDVTSAVTGAEARLRAEIAASETRLRAEIAASEARIRAEMATKADLQTVQTEVRVISGRLDEQRSILAALIPTHIAAVPAAPEGRAGGKSRRPGG